MLALLKASETQHGLEHWISKAAGIKRLNHRLAEDLCDLGILRQDERKILFIFTQQVYPELDSTWEDSIRRRMANVMFREGAQADARTGALISLAYHSGLLKPNFAPDQPRQHQTRIAELASGEHLASNATKATIEAVQAAIVAATIASTLAASTAASTASS